MPTKKSSAPPLAISEDVTDHILLIRGQKVMLDSDLARLYGVTTKRLNEQVKRNYQRFPDDFMFQLTITEAKELLDSRSQIATLNRGQNIKYAPNAFTEHGAVMLASVLNSPIAVEASIQVVRAFIRLRSILAVNKELARKIEAIDRRTTAHDAKFSVVFKFIDDYLKSKKHLPSAIGFRTGKKK